ncbi:MAG: hypothetical protein ABRQ39_09605 [Candidatus Eremiobacterota bacterium]
MNKILKTIALTVLLISMITGIMQITCAASLSPQWTVLTAEQKRFLLEAFNINENEQKTLWDPMPENIKQFIIDSIWKSMTPEKQQQVLIYAHIDKPFSKESDEASKMPAPKWNSLTARQQGILIQAFNFDDTQIAVWSNLPVEIKQVYIDAAWPYIDIQKKHQVLSATGNKEPYASPTPGTSAYPSSTPVPGTYYPSSSEPAPKWNTMNASQQQALMMVMNFDSTQTMIWTYLTPEMKQMFVDYIWQYFNEDIKTEIMAGNTQKIQVIMAEQAKISTVPPQWNTLDAEKQQKLVVLMKLDPTLWNFLPVEMKQGFINTIWKFIPPQKQKEIMEEVD